MKVKNMRFSMIISMILIAAALLSGCLKDPNWMPSDVAPTPTITPPPESSETAPTSSTAAPTTEPTAVPTDTPTQEPTATLEPTPEPTATPEPTPPSITALPSDDLGAANYTDASDQISYIFANLGSNQPHVEEYCAYIKGQSMSMDGQTDIIFDYVEWLSDPEATTAYLEDHPGADPEDYEFIQEIGYIRNTEPDTVTLHTSPDTRYYLNRPEFTSQIGEVDYDEFRDWLFTLSYDPLVIVCEVDGIIARVEWVYMP